MGENGAANGQHFVESTDYEGNVFQYICRVGDVGELLQALESMRWTDVLHQYDFCGRQVTHAVAEDDQANAKSKIEILWNMGADINAKELIMGNTLLHIAVITRNYLLAEWICRTPGADLGAVNSLQDTAYQVAYRISDLGMMEVLRTNGAVCDDPSDELDTSSESLELTPR
ncbi:GSCOCT00013118001.2-RA-CDS [Cotesia congregata]|uniref:Cc_vank.8_16.2 n=2 Tax=root TaxID=1 RepID=S6D9L5_COTCN|nr:GSCOCT00013118001.2-RA-CDS [Cotesia congregata]CAG5092568.1 cc_vank.8_16.2 [Cotesia congregata]CCB96379.1 viral ankyrin VANK-8 [Bracoviriform congregatae]CCQ71283.1 viral ankyrin VANK-8 [Cotesia congregata]